MKKIIGPLIIILLGLTVIIVSISISFGWWPTITENIRNFFVNVIGAILGFFAVIYGVWKAAPEPIKNIIATVLRKIPNLPNYYKRTTVQFELESEINTALKEFGKDGAGFIDKEVKIKWLTPGEHARRLFFQGGKAYLKLDFDEDKERNLVEAVFLYCNECLLPEVRQYVERPLMHAIDLTFIDELLERRNAFRGRAYFTQEVIPREIEANKDIEKYIDVLELINQHGLFIRVFLPELREYPGRTQRRVTRKNHLQQIEEFLTFLKDTAEERTKSIKRAWLHIGETIRIGIILVGQVDKLQYEGTKPYVRRAALDNSNGARTVYLIGYNLGNNYVTNIAREVQQRGISNESEIHEYQALIGTEVKKQTIARLSIPDGAGSEFLKQYPNMAEWPDLHEETIYSVIKEKDSIKVTGSDNNIPDDLEWEKQLNDAWLKRANKTGLFIYCPVASQDILDIFGVHKIRECKYKTIKGIFDASIYLRERWKYEENKIIKL
jgi:hypothetical protein